MTLTVMGELSNKTQNQDEQRLMDARTYRVNSMREAVELIRSDLGPEASVLHARRLNRSWFSWIRGGARLEVIGSRDVPVPRRVVLDQSREQAVDNSPMSRVADDWSEICVHLKESGWVDADLKELQRRLNDGLADTLKGIDDECMLSRCFDLVADGLPIAPALQPAIGRPRVVAMVGPTGVGKTTCLAKLADHLRRTHRARVGLITVDTMRFGAVEQLKTYADLLAAPMETGRTQAGLAAAVARLAHLDFILIDTCGFSLHDQQRLDQLRTLLRGAPIDETILVTNCQTTASVFRHMFVAFTLLGVKSIVLSKLDESGALGHMWGSLVDSPWPIRYVTGGPDIQDGFHVAAGEELAMRMFPIRLQQRPSDARPRPIDSSGYRSANFQHGGAMYD